jgi:hypothetical protein
MKPELFAGLNIKKVVVISGMPEEKLWVAYPYYQFGGIPGYPISPDFTTKKKALDWAKKQGYDVARVEEWTNSAPAELRNVFFHKETMQL